MTWCWGKDFADLVLTVSLFKTTFLHVLEETQMKIIDTVPSV
jgi:hypothetical protein